jgi:sirohydrochlorin cobaltochelatase
MNPPASKTLGLVLFAHGARDARWSEPFRRLTSRVQSGMPDARVRLAYLEHTDPDLATMVAQLVGEGVAGIRIVPIFLGQGGHLRRDIPALLASLQARYPDVALSCAPAIGEDEGVLDAMAQACIREAGAAGIEGR